MTDPVIIESGYTFERKAIQEHFKKNDNCPISGQIINNKQIVTPNYALKAAIAAHDQGNAYIPECSISLDPIDNGKLICRQRIIGRNGN